LDPVVSFPTSSTPSVVAFCPTDAEILVTGDEKGNTNVYKFLHPGKESDDPEKKLNKVLNQIGKAAQKN
jgi:hypothetical protein